MASLTFEDQLLALISDEADLQEAEEFLSELPGYEPGFTVLYWRAESTHEEYFWEAVLHRDNEFYLVRGGYSVMSDCNGPDEFQPILTTAECALAEVRD